MFYTKKENYTNRIFFIHLFIIILAMITGIFLSPTILKAKPYTEADNTNFQRLELVFVDSGIRDYQTLLDDFKTQIQKHVNIQIVANTAATQCK